MFLHTALCSRYCNPTHGVVANPMATSSSRNRASGVDGESVRYTPHRSMRLHMEFSVWSSRYGVQDGVECLFSGFLRHAFGVLIYRAMCCRVCDFRNDIRCCVKSGFIPHIETCIRIASLLDIMSGTACLLVHTCVFHAVLRDGAIRQTHFRMWLPRCISFVLLVAVLQETASTIHVACSDC